MTRIECIVTCHYLSPLPWNAVVESQTFTASNTTLLSIRSTAVSSEECCSDKGRRRKSDTRWCCHIIFWFNGCRSVPPVIRFTVADWSCVETNEYFAVLDGTLYNNLCVLKHLALAHSHLRVSEQMQAAHYVHLRDGLQWWLVVRRWMCQHNLKCSLTGKWIIGHFEKPASGVNELLNKLVL